MSVKRAQTDRSGGRNARDESAVKVDRQELWDELQKRVDAQEPFTPGEVAKAVGAPEAAVAKHLLSLAYERMLEKVDAGRYRSAPLKDASQADFIRALNAKIDPKRQQDQMEIERLKRNNDEMRRRLLEVMAERDRLVELLKKHGIEPTG